MKRTLTMLAVAGLACGTASAQSNVTVFGALDLGLRHIGYSDNGSLNTLGTFGASASFLGFRGTEDLGGGLKASFWLEGAVLPDTGQSAADAFGAPFWNRGAWVELSGGFGAVRLGRDWSASYFGQWEFDPTFNLGLGDQLHLSHVDGNFLWRNNSVTYISPSLGGFSVRLMGSPSEGGAAGSYTAGRASYAAGPLNVAASYGTTSGTTGGNYKLANVGASYDFGVVRAMMFVSSNKLESQSERRVSVAASVPLGAGAAWASYGTVSTNSAGEAAGWFGANQVAAGYGYNLSKRTGLYANVSRLSNKLNGVLNVEEPGSYSAKTRAGGSATGFELGMRHSF